MDVVIVVVYQLLAMGPGRILFPTLLLQLFNRFGIAVCQLLIFLFKVLIEVNADSVTSLCVYCWLAEECQLINIFEHVWFAWNTFESLAAEMLSVLFQTLGDGGGGHWLVQMESCPARWSVCLPLLIFPCTIKSRSSLLAPAHLGGPRNGRKMVVVLLQTWLHVWNKIL